MEKTIETGKKVIKALDEKKGLNIKFMDLRKVNSYLDFFIIVTGSSKMHLRALTKTVQKTMHEEGYGLRAHPEIDSEWIVLDYFDLIIHLFSEETREYYNLERLWSDAEIISKDE